MQTYKHFYKHYKHPNLQQIFIHQRNDTRKCQIEEVLSRNPVFSVLIDSPSFLAKHSEVEELN
jgi:hypothetical protein